MPDSHTFVEPSEDEGLEPAWALAFPDLPEDKASWLLESIASEYRPTKDDPTKEQEAAVSALRRASSRYRDLGLARFKCSILFLDSLAYGFLDPEAGANFDWDGLFSDREGTAFIFESHTIQLMLGSCPEVRDAWLRVPLGTRAEAYANNAVCFIGFIEMVEGIALPAASTDSLWKALAMYPDRIGSLRELAKQSVDPLDLSRLPTEEERMAVRGLYLRLLTDGSKGLVATMYDSLPFHVAVDEIFGFISESAEGSATQIPGEPRNVNEPPISVHDDPRASARICWSYLLERLAVADPDDAFSFLCRILPLSEDTIVEYFGNSDASSFSGSAACVVDALFREDVLPLVERSLRSTRGVTRRRDPFSRAILAEIDSRLAGDPRSRMAFLYSLYVRWFDSMSSEHIPSLGDMKSIEPMVLESIKETGVISSLLCLEDYCDINELQEVSWRDAIAMILARLRYQASTEAVTADERDRLFFAALSEQSYTDPKSAFFSNPCLEYARPMFDQEFVTALQSDTESCLPEAQRLLAVAIALGERDACDYIGSRLQENGPALFLPYVAFALSRFDCDGAIEPSSPERLEELGLFKVLPLGVLRFLVTDESLLLEAIVARYFSGGMNDAHPNVSDFISRYSSLIFEKSDSLDRTLKPAARRIVKAEALGRLARIVGAGAGEGLGDDAHIGLGLADLILYDAGADPTSDPEFSDACKKAAQRWFDNTRACARSGASWGDLPSPEPCLQASVSILWKLKGTWPALKQLLTLFRHIPEASIGRDLAPRGEGLADSWLPIAARINFVLDRPWTNEEGRALRAEMTHDLLNKLKTSKDPAKKALVEPDETWRYAYVRAVADLGADPSDTGHFHHQVLDKCAANDPSPRVSEAAKAASTSLKTRTGWKAGSSRRMLLHAWWWIRQAHLISTGAEIDRDAALKLREAETRI